PASRPRARLRARPGRPHGGAPRAAGAARGRRRRPARAGAPPSPSQPLSRSAPREDGCSPSGRRARRAAARGGGAGDAAGRPDRRRGRGSAVRLTDSLRHTAPVTQVKGQVEEPQQRDPEREARRRAALTTVRQSTDTVLRMRTVVKEAYAAEIV